MTEFKTDVSKQEFELIFKTDNREYFEKMQLAARECIDHKPTTNFDRIKAMSVEELAAFLKSMVDDCETHEVACYGCINYGTHHSDPNNKGTNLYECEGCYCEGIGHDIVKWLESEVEGE